MNLPRTQKYAALLTNRIPDSVFRKSMVSCETPNKEQWICCKFSMHPSQETIIAIGSNTGDILFADAKYAHDRLKFGYKELMSNGENGNGDAACLGIEWLPNRENLLIALHAGSHFQVRLWDIEKHILFPFEGHTFSVRCISVWPDNPNCFVTGSKDGSIMAWDIRRSPHYTPVTKSSQPSHLDALTMTLAPKLDPFRAQKMAHDISSQPLSKTKRLSMCSGFPTITALLHYNENYLISAASSASSGIRVWDLRYQKASKPVQVLHIPQHSSRETGITSMSWDRYHTNFFATCTDNHIYEYSMSSKTPLPVRSLKANMIGSVYVNCVTSPISDHLLVGSSHDHALLFDLQESRMYKQDQANSVYHPRRQQTAKYLNHPKFKFGGHRFNTEKVDWSSTGNYIATLDEYCLRIWSSRYLARVRDPDEQLNEVIIDDMPVKLIRPELLLPPDKTSQISRR